MEKKIKEKKYEVSRNGYGSLAMFQELKSLHWNSGTYLMLLHCKGILRDPQVKKLILRVKPISLYSFKC